MLTIDNNGPLLGLMRHSETMFSAKGVTNGQSDDYNVGLTEEGIAIAEEAGKELLPYNINGIYFSPLVRAKQTAEIIGQTIGVKGMLLPELIEVDMGNAEGSGNLLLKVIPRVHSILNWNVKLKKGEAFNEVMDRYLTSLSKVTNNYQAIGETPRVLLITHTGFINIATVTNSLLEGNELSWYHKRRQLFSKPPHASVHFTKMPSANSINNLKDSLAQPIEFKPLHR